MFSNIDIFLCHQGFTFFNLIFAHGTHFVGRMASPIMVMQRGNEIMSRQIAGHLITTDAVYYRDPVSRLNTRDYSMNDILKLICISELTGQVEYTFELLTWLKSVLTGQGDVRNAETIGQVYTLAERSYNKKDRHIP